MVSAMLERINLVPRQPLASSIRAYTPLVLMIVVGCISLIIYTRHNYLKKEITETGQQLSEMQASLNGYNALQSIINNEKVEAARLTELAAQATTKVRRFENMQFEKRKFSLLIKDIALSLPDSIICNRVQFTGNTCEIKGIAKGYHDLPGFVEKLKKNNQFTQVTLGDVLRKSGENNDIIFEFNIIADLLQGK